MRLAARGRRVPHEFVLEALADLAPTTRPMFVGLAVYVEEKNVPVLRDKPSGRADNGVWLATTAEHHESLRRVFPRMRSIGVLGKTAYRLAGSAGRCRGLRDGTVFRYIP